MPNYLLSCESTVDMPFSYVNGRGIRVLFYNYTVEGNDYPDDMDRDPMARRRFYGFIAKGHIPTTSQINQFAYEEFFRSILSDGYDIFHICFGTGMTASYNNALLAMETMKAEFPDRKMIVIDSLCSSSGYGLLVDDVKDMLDEGKPVEEVAEWVEQNKGKVHHQFYSHDLKYFKRTGRMSGPVATLASIMHVCPIMHLNAAGKIIAYDKVFGKKAAIEATIKTMEEHCQDGLNYSKKVFISHSESAQEAVLTKKMIEERFPHVKEVRIFNIGTIIASHSGPGTVAVYFWGDERV